MIKTIFYIKAQENQLGENPIFVKITYRTESITLSTGKFIKKDRWLFTNKLRNPLKLEKEKVIKKGLEMFQLEIERKFNDLIKYNPEVTLNDLKLAVKGTSKKPKSITIIEIFNLHNKNFKKKVEIGERSKASLQKYERSKQLLINFLSKQYGVKDIEVTEISSALIYNLDSYLRYDSNFKGKTGIKNNSVVKYFKTYKTVCTYGIKMDLITKNPFSKYDGKLNIKDAVYLTQHELDTIESKVFASERLERVKNIFLFSCYTGYAPVDACSLTEENLFEDANCNLWIKTYRTKTAIRANVPVLPPTFKIIEKYKDQQSGLIPKISNQKMNAYLKEIADVCGINKNLTWYVARHTFATTVTLGNGIRIEHVSSMMGHTNIKQTQHYAKVLDMNVMEDMSKLKLRYNK